MTADVRAWIRQCAACEAQKVPAKRYKAPLQSYQMGHPFERIAVDVLGPLPETYKGNKCILVVGDYFTKWVEAIALPNQEAETVAQSLVDTVISRFGVPKELHSDQGRNFESKLFAEMCQLLGIDKPVRHPTILSRTAWSSASTEL